MTVAPEAVAPSGGVDRPPAPDRAPATRRRVALQPSLVAGALFVVVVLLLVPAVSSIYWLKVFTTVAIYAVAAAGIGLLYGRLGLVSLGQVALLGVGGWIALRLGHGTGLPFGVLLLAAGLGTMVVGVLVGLPALRLSGLDLAIVTLMFAAAFAVVFNATGFPDGGDGFLGRISGAGNQEAVRRPALGVSDPAFFRYTVVVAALVFLVFALHLRRRPGRAWAAIRQSEAGALAAGVDTTRYKLWALALVSFGTGVAGGLLGANTGLLDPISFKASESIVLYAVVLIGGAFSGVGAIIAGLFSQAVPALLDTLGINGNLIFVVFGIGLIHAISTAPRGIAGQLEDLGRAIGRRVRPEREDDDA